MEKKNNPESIGENEFLRLVYEVQQGDPAAMEKLLDMFESDMRLLSKYIPMPEEDALQSMKLEFITLIKNKVLDQKGSSDEEE
ncbi:helix-turn-helix domain-containing protein [Paenibacillus polygoni]|uniref:Helix-turn-helix domain-containing protein n=1 Tax=Paenibacillus polygoni TaxID=3050112 RepID=A0ABY8X4Y8_9BACL|nr:helix-turn-helix domain-containing protein [Paenibacillus polygoni]WIV19546.1 helix-turn-helix domain-containing protein [Paenibacillus polygoni]